MVLQRSAGRPDAQHPETWAVKDFSVIRYNNQWQVYAATATPDGWNLVHYAFDDWSQAASARHTYLDTTAIGKGYRAAPQVLFFAPQNLWYLIYQTPWPVCRGFCRSAGAATRRKRSPSSSPGNGQRSSRDRSATHRAALLGTSRSAEASQPISSRRPRACR